MQRRRRRGRAPRCSGSPCTGTSAQTSPLPRRRGLLKMERETDVGLVGENNGPLAASVVLGLGEEGVEEGVEVELDADVLGALGREGVEGRAALRLHPVVCSAQPSEGKGREQGKGLEDRTHCQASRPACSSRRPCSRPTGTAPSTPSSRTSCTTPLYRWRVSHERSAWERGGGDGELKVLDTLSAVSGSR